jgi:chromosomal replication initiation ATPase DnaA
MTDDMSDSDFMEQIQQNDDELRKRLASGGETHQQMKDRVKDRIQKIANSHDIDFPDEVIQESELAVERSIEERTSFLRDARSNKWDSKIPPRWRGWTMDRLPKGFRIAANKWISEGFNNSQNLILSGPTGSGKTSMAYAIGREMYLLGHKVKIWQAAELFDEMRGTEQSKDVLESVKNSDLLILDDLGSERKTDWVEERLFLIIDYRWQWKLPTIVTTNFTADQLPDKISERVISRLMDSSTFLVVDGKDYRTDAD